MVKLTIHAQKGSRTQTEEMPKACNDTEQSRWMSAVHPGLPLMPRNFLSGDYRSDILHYSAPVVSQKVHVLLTAGVQQIPIRKSKFHPEEKQQLLEGN